MGPSPLNIEYQDLLPEYKEQLYTLLPNDMHYALAKGKVSVVAAVRMVRLALDTVKDKFDSSMSELVSWRESNWKVARAYCGHYKSSPPSDPSDDPALWYGQMVWGDGRMTVLRPGFFPDVEFGDARKRQIRWMAYVGVAAADYFFSHHLSGPGPPPPLTPVYRGRLSILDPNAIEGNVDLEAVAYARRLTASDNPDRERYRAQRYREGKPNYPVALLDAVAEYQGVRISTAHERLKRGGYRHPNDLARVFKRG